MENVDPWIARLLSPDDAVITEVAIPHFRTYIEIAVPTVPVATSLSDTDIDDAPAFTTVIFELDRRDTAFTQLLEPRVLIFRQSSR